MKGACGIKEYNDQMAIAEDWSYISQAVMGLEWVD